MSASRPNPPPGSGAVAPAPAPAKIMNAQALQSSVSNLTNNSSQWLDRVFPPQKRQQVTQAITKFSSERPYLASFLLSQLAISALPILLMTIMAFVFALLTGVLMGALGAFLFISGVMGFTFLILLPVLFFTSGTAVVVWLWGLLAYSILTWLQQRNNSASQGGPQTGLVKTIAGLNGAPQSGQNQAPGQVRPQPGPQQPMQRPPPNAQAQVQPGSQQPAQPPPPNATQQQQAGLNPTNPAPPQRPSSPNSQVPPRKPVSRPSSPNPVANGENSEGHNNQMPERKPVPSRSPSPQPMQNGTSATGAQPNGGNNNPQGGQPVARPPPNGAAAGSGGAAPQQLQPTVRPPPHGAAPTAMRAVSGSSAMSQAGQSNAQSQDAGQQQPMSRPPMPPQSQSQTSLAAMVAQGLNSPAEIAAENGANGSGRGQ